IAQFILDYLDPDTRSPVEECHQFVSIEGALELVKGCLSLQALKVGPEPVDPVGGQASPLLTAGGYVGRSQFEQIIPVVARVQGEASHRGVGPARIVRGGPPVQVDETLDGGD